jgi:hypothetical protein
VFSETHLLLKVEASYFPERGADTAPSAKAQGSMPRLHSSLRRSPALISCNYCYRPRRADRRRPIDATVGHGHPVRVSADVLEGLDAVVLSGETDMNDTMEVQAQAYLMGYPEAAWWVEYFPNLYGAGLIQGFVLKFSSGSRSSR